MSLSFAVAVAVVVVGITGTTMNPLKSNSPARSSRSWNEARATEVGAAAHLSQVTWAGKREREREDRRSKRT